MFKSLLRKQEYLLALEKRVLEEQAELLELQKSVEKQTADLYELIEYAELCLNTYGITKKDLERIKIKNKLKIVK